MELIPAIIPKSAEDLKDKLESVRGLADTIHVDFILPLSGVLRLQSERGMFFEAHLMVPHPEEYIADAIKAGFSRVLVHAEALSTEAFAELIHEWKGSVEIGAVLEIETPLSAINSFAHELETVQLMGIAEIGAQGRPFDPRVIPRIKTLHAQYPHLTISVDGGVNKENAKMLTDTGASRLVVGSAIAEFYG